MVMAHQYLGQLEPKILDALLGNTGTIIAFRLGPDDARVIARTLDPPFGPSDLMNLPNHHIYPRLLIDGMPSTPFSAETLRLSSSS